MKLDLNKLAPVRANKRSELSYDLQYRPKYGKWRVTDLVFAQLDLNNNGFNLMLHPDGVIVLQLVPEANAQLVKRRSNASNKGLEFTSGSLRTLLDHKFSGVNDFQLTDVGEMDGNRFFAVEAFNTSITESLVDEADMVEDAPAIQASVTVTAVEAVIEPDDAETTEMVEAVAAEAENVEVSEEVEDIAPMGSIDLGETQVIDETSQEVATESTASSEPDGESDELDLEDIPAAPAAKEVVKNPFTSF